MRILLFISVLWFFSLGLSAQYTVGATLGISTHGSDSNSWGRHGIKFYENTKTVYGVQLKKQLSENFALNLQYRNTQIEAQDENLIDKASFGNAISNRSLGYHSEIHEIALIIEYELGAFFKSTNEEGKLEYKIRKPLSPFIFTGLGFAIINDNEDLRDWGNPDLIREMDVLLDQSQGSKGGIQIPLGFGLKINFTELFYLDIKYGARLPISDYLDGISESANPEKNDAYQFLTIGFNFRF